ncbi:MAG: hypothetical protein RL490_1549 [Pseudomonadota bacterium]
MTTHIDPLPDLALNLALAMVESSAVPLLLLDGQLHVVAVSKSFCVAFGVDQASVTGKSVFAMGAGAWELPRLRSLLQATISGGADITAYELDLQRAAGDRRSLVVNAHIIEYGASEAVRMLLTVADVTDARLSTRIKDDLVREKAVLLQELQHRIANSLQIVSSVLLQSARNVQSTESKGHLTDAHNRVMSVAALQRLLSQTNVDMVPLRAYLVQLCDSIGASMIHDHDLVQIAVLADDSAVKPDVSVSLGLIVTELVINALKHAFPDRRAGKIRVEYSAADRDWTLAIADDGIGMVLGAGAAKAGLGTSIVQALARQLEAVIKVTDTNPGTKVHVSHSEALNALPDVEAI